MIFGYFHEGSGLGDQLFRYITVRTIAEQKGYEWGMWQPKNFKGNEFMSLNMGNPVEQNMEYGFFQEKDVRDAQGNDIRSYDPEVNFIRDWMSIDGSFEDDKYWRHNLQNIKEWLKTEPLDVSDDTCVTGFRGGEYAHNQDLFLTREYWESAMFKMPGKEFEVHTDDPGTACVILAPMVTSSVRLKYIENNQISHSKHSNMGFNWRSMRNAKYAIIPNSAFFILPRILKHLEDPEAITIAPRYWARRNVGVWARPACYYPEFLYI